jgi:hypothetical protein
MNDPVNYPDHYGEWTMREATKAVDANLDSI